MNIVKVISSTINAVKTRAVKVLRLGDKDVQEVAQIAPYGVDAHPIEGMVAVYAPTLQKGEEVIIGYLNKNQLAEVGEHRIFSTDGSGVLKMYLHLKNDGSAHFGGDSDYMVRFSGLESAFNEFRSDVNAHISEYNTHSHIYAPGPLPPVATAPTTSTSSPSTADIVPARIDEIRTLQ